MLDKNSILTKNGRVGERGSFEKLKILKINKKIKFQNLFQKILQKISKNFYKTKS